MFTTLYTKWSDNSGRKVEFSFPMTLDDVTDEVERLKSQNLLAGVEFYQNRLTDDVICEIQVTDAY
jgi:hypothetical protein